MDRKPPKRQRELQPKLPHQTSPKIRVVCKTVKAQPPNSNKNQKTMASTTVFAQAIDALVAERDRVFIQRVCDDYKLDFKELSAKYFEAAESAIKVPRKYKKREPKSVTVTVAEGETEPKAKAPKEAKVKQCCTAHTSKKEPCKFNALKGEVFCKRHLKQSLNEAEPKAPKEPKAKKAKKVEKPLEPVHSHQPDAEVHDDCDLCQSHGNAMSAEAEEFELVDDSQMRVAQYNKKTALKAVEREGMTADMQEHLTYCDEEIERLSAKKAAPVKQTTVQERLAALLADSDESDSDSDCGEALGEEVYDEE